MKRVPHPFAFFAKRVGTASDGGQLRKTEPLYAGCCGSHPLKTAKGRAPSFIVMSGETLEWVGHPPSFQHWLYRCREMNPCFTRDDYGDVDSNRAGPPNSDSRPGGARVEN